MGRTIPVNGSMLPSRRLTAIARVLGFIIVTLAYFQILQALKDSEFLNADIVSQTAASILESEHASLSSSALTLSRAGNRWIGVSSGAKGDAELYLQQVVISMDDFGAIKRQSPSPNLRDGSNLLKHISAFDSALRYDPILKDSKLAWDPDLCYRPTSKAECFSVTPFSAEGRDESHLLYTDSTAVSMFYAFAGDTEEGQREWLAKFQQSSDLTSLSYVAPSAPSEGENISFTPINHRMPSASVASRSIGSEAPAPLMARLAGGFGIAGSPSRQERVPTLAQPSIKQGQLREMQNVSWMYYGFKAFVMQFWRLLKQADSADIFIMLGAYIIMHMTFIKLYLNMRALGHKFWLATCTLVSSVFAFLLALDCAYLLNMTVNPVILSEALPFLVIIIGFEKPYVLARAVFRHPAVRGHSEPATSRPDLGFFQTNADKRSNNLSMDEPSSASLKERFETKPAKEIVIEAVDKHGTQIVRDYAIEIAFLLAGSVCGISGLTEFCQLAALILAFDCAFLFVFYSSVLTVLIEVRRIKRMRGLRRADSTSELAKILDDGTNSPPRVQEEGSLTYKQSVIKLITGITPNKESGFTLRATPKLLLLVAFLGVHVLNLFTPLATSTAINRHNSSAMSPYSFSRSDATSPAVAFALKQLSALHSADFKIIAHLAPPLLIRMDIPGASPPLTSLEGIAPVFRNSATPLAVLDRFMSGWSTLAGDPVMSKWIVITLVISVFLNGYLLKGIALVDTDRAQAAQNAARILLASTGQLAYDEDRPVKMMRRHSSAMARNGPNYSESEQRSYNDGDSRPGDAAESPDFPRSPPLLSMPLKAKRLSGEQKLSTAFKSKLDKVKEIESPTETRSHATASQQPSIALTNPSGPLTPTTISETSFLMSDLGGTSTPATTAESDLISDDAQALTPRPPRSFEECAKIFDAGGTLSLTDEELIILVQKGKLAAYSLETLLKDHRRAVRVRRALISRASTTKTLEHSELPYMHYDYSKVMGQCCENVVGYVPIPVGIAGPLRIDGVPLPIPMATTEGALVASTSRGCKALNAGGGVITALTQDAMTRGPALEFNSISECAAARLWIESEEGDTILKAAFNSTSRFARLQRLKCTNAGRTLFVRFATQTGDAMGMNMISKGCERALETMMETFPKMRILALSGNYCTDKKPAAINWIEGRGKSVVSEAVIPGNVVKTILKTTVADVVKLNISKNLIGSAMAGSIGGNNAHASNVLTAIYLACGQDPAQNVESSNCMTLMEAVNDGQDLLITCTMPSIEVGTIGGGTILTPQRAMLDMLGVGGPHPSQPGANAQQLARIICASVMAGELSLMSALAAGHLVKSHLALNRSQPVTPSTNKVTKHTFLTPAPSPGPAALRQKSFLTPLKGIE